MNRFLKVMCNEENVGKINKFKLFMLKLLCKVTSPLLIFWTYYTEIKFSIYSFKKKKSQRSACDIPGIFIPETSLRIHVVRIYFTEAKLSVAFSKNLLQCGCHVAPSSSVVFVDTKNKQWTQRSTTTLVYFI